ncbi:MAG: NAD/NADP octopine/nopaline dehydrogenase family protein [Deltaproteobacteria bacterium]
MQAVAELAPARLEICVVGAGSLGQAQAGHLASLGHRVHLYNRSANRLAPLRESGKVELSGVLSGAFELASLTTDLAAAIAHASVVFVDVPASGHLAMANALAPLLRRQPEGEGPLLVLHPGQTFGARHFARALERAGVRKAPPVCELQTALYTCRAGSGGRASVFALKQRVAASVYPRSEAPALGPLKAIYPQLIAAPSTLHTGLTNLQGIIHPAAVLFNLSRVDRGDRFRIYREGLSGALGAFIEKADRERLSVAKALGAAVPTAAQWFSLSYGVTGSTAVEAMRNVPAYADLEAPRDLATRLLWEDIPTGLVPLLSLAEALGVEAGTLRLLRDLAVSVCGPKLLEDGWDLARIGLPGADAEAVRQGF